MCTESPVWGNTTRLCSGGGEWERSWTNVNARSFSTPSSVMDYHLNSDYLSNIVLHIRILIYQISNIRYGFSASIHKRQAKQLGRYGHEAWRHQSVGTSDTVFVWLDQPQPQLTVANTVDDQAYMALLRYGSRVFILLFSFYFFQL